MKRMAATLAVLGALSAVVPATAVAETKSTSSCNAGVLLLLRFC